MSQCKDKSAARAEAFSRAGTIHSMTGYAAGTRDVGFGVVNFEMKSVNSRYLDFQFRLCDELRAAEPALRDLIAARVRRGKLECRMGCCATSFRASASFLDAELLRRIKELEESVRREFPLARALTVNEILRWPGMLKDDLPEAGFAEAIPACLALAEEALGDFLASRAREGDKLAAEIRRRITEARECVLKVAPWIDEAQASFEERLRQRLSEALFAPDDNRISQEVVLFAARIDVAEELARLTAHLDETERILDIGGVCGKRLDFLMQELNREANTLGSKSMIPDVSRTAMELKLLIEQMREQVQNLE
ncbi:MAG: YicC family protein [Candidatus Accumulibacter sp.]|jgi:uncharacterized protein (TIGR00255 family)|nr:YicC family protein [Accumulibacter sp.]